MKTAVTPIRASDKLQSLFERDERLIDIVASHSPQLAKLRKSPMRRIMAHVTTVAQAARMCNVSADTLVRELNSALGIESAAETTAENAAAADDLNGTAAAAWQDPASPVVELDVREDVAQGREPFGRIMAAVAALREGEALHLRAPFEPVPLFGVMEKRGFGHRAKMHAPDDWSVWFFRQQTSQPNAEAEPQRAASPAPAASLADAGARTEVRLDVRDLEPPEPLVRTLGALESLPSGSVLLHVNVRVPQLLLPILTERGFSYTIEELQDQVQVRIWRQD